MRATEGARIALLAARYVEGQSIVLEYRSAQGMAGWLVGLATDLARLKVDAIVTTGPPASRRRGCQTSSRKAP